jgi:hypothetical protein
VQAHKSRRAQPALRLRPPDLDLSLHYNSDVGTTETSDQPLLETEKGLGAGLLSGRFPLEAGVIDLSLRRSLLRIRSVVRGRAVLFVLTQSCGKQSRAAHIHELFWPICDPGE